MPRLDENGLMAGSAEHCENRSAGASKLARCQAMPLGCGCANRDSEASEEAVCKWDQPGNRNPGVHNRLDEQPRERGQDYRR